MPARAGGGSRSAPSRRRRGTPSPRRRSNGGATTARCPSPWGSAGSATRSASRARSRRLRGEGRSPWGRYRRERRGTVGSRRMPDVVVIGGGVVGTMAAWQLAEAGAEVTLFERGALASGATSRSQGLVLPPDHAALVRLWQESIAMYTRLHDAGAEFCFDRDEPIGTLLLARHRGQLSGLAAAPVAGE